jgi:hypothetical protein
LHLECEFVHYKKGSTEYFHAYTKEGLIYMLSAEKKRMSFSYTISSDYKNFDNGNDVLAILKSNLLGTEFNVAKMNEIYTSKFEDLTHLIGSMMYEFNIFGLRGPRKMKVYIPQLDSYDKPLPIEKNDVYWIINLEKR